VFKGTTLRGMLLNAYAFWQMGVIALWAALVSFIGAGLLIILSVLGFVHARWAGPGHRDPGPARSAQGHHLTTRTPAPAGRSPNRRAAPAGPPVRVTG
jgi:hypothetical protein